MVEQRHETRWAICYSIHHVSSILSPFSSLICSVAQGHYSFLANAQWPGGFFRSWNGVSARWLACTARTFTRRSARSSTRCHVTRGWQDSTAIPQTGQRLSGTPFGKPAVAPLLTWSLSSVSLCDIIGLVCSEMSSPGVRMPNVRCAPPDRHHRRRSWRRSSRGFLPVWCHLRSHYCCLAPIIQPWVSPLVSRNRESLVQAMTTRGSLERRISLTQQVTTSERRSLLLRPKTALVDTERWSTSWRSAFHDGCCILTASTLVRPSCFDATCAPILWSCSRRKRLSCDTKNSAISFDLHCVHVVHVLTFLKFWFSCLWFWFSRFGHFFANQDFCQVFCFFDTFSALAWFALDIMYIYIYRLADSWYVFQLIAVFHFWYFTVLIDSHFLHACIVFLPTVHTYLCYISITCVFLGFFVSQFFVLWSTRLFSWVCIIAVYLCTCMPYRVFYYLFSLLLSLRDDWVCQKFEAKKSRQFFLINFFVRFCTLGAALLNASAFSWIVLNVTVSGCCRSAV